MIKRSNIKKILIVILFSLIILCPLGIYANSNYAHASAKIKCRTTLVKSYRNSIRNDEKILDTKNGHYYINIYKNLLNNKKYLKYYQKKNRQIKSKLYPFRIKGKKLRKYNDIDYWSRIGTTLATINPRHGIYVQEIKVENPHANNRVIKTKRLKRGTKVKIDLFSKGFEVKSRLLPAKKGCYWQYWPIRLTKQGGHC